MTRRTRYLLLALLGAALVGGFILWPRQAPIDLTDVYQRWSSLDDEVVAARAAPDPAATYQPRVAGKITDAQAPAVEILRQLPGIVAVEPLVACDRPARRIIHFRDWHAVPPEPYRADVVARLGRPVSRAEFELRYQTLLMEVELVMIEQTAALRCLVRHHGLERVLAGRLTPSDLPEFRATMAVLQREAANLDRLKKNRKEIKGNADRDRELRLSVIRLQDQLVPYGVMAQLAIDEAAEVLPLDAEDALEAAKPVRPDGTVGVALAKLEARHDAQVRAALASGPVAVLVLGAAHDLSAAVQRLGDASTEYLRVTTKAVARFADSNAP